MNELNPGQYSSEKDHQYEMSVEMSYGSGEVTRTSLLVNARSPSHAKTLAQKAGYRVTSGARKVA